MKKEQGESDYCHNLWIKMMLMNKVKDEDKPKQKNLNSNDFNLKF